MTAQILGTVLATIGADVDAEADVIAKECVAKGLQADRRDKIFGDPADHPWTTMATKNHRRVAGDRHTADLAHHLMALKVAPKRVAQPQRTIPPENFIERMMRFDANGDDVVSSDELPSRLRTLCRQWRRERGWPA